MFRRGLIIPVVLAALPVAAAAWVFSPAFLETRTEPEPGTRTAAPRQAALNVPDLGALAPRDGSATSPAFDVVRISPDDFSVFAGTAPPNTTVTVTADGKPIGTARADERGEWTLLSDHRFANAAPVLGLSTASREEPQVAVRDEAGARPAAGTLAPPARMMRDLEDLVAAARNPGQPAKSDAAARTSVPVPIQFVFRQAVFTGEGRKAAELLSEYLRLKKPESIVLTGHADERGNEAFNLELSRQRLATVADYLRQNGYQGRLVLIPKGSSEPYRDVDRASLDRHTLWQLDRRVELDLGPLVQPHRSVRGGSSSVPR